MRRYGIALGLVAVTAVASGGPRLDAAGGPRLRAISATSGARPAVLIEASEPVAFASARPDPFTVLVDLRNVASAGYANGFVPEAGSLVRSITVEPGRAEDGAEISRVRVSLSEPVGHQVRSQRNLIFVELDRDATPSAVPVPVTAPAPASLGSTDASKALAHVLRAVRTEYSASGTSVVLVGDGRLVAKGVENAGSRRVYLDFPGVTPAVAAVTAVGKGGVDRVRVGLNSRDPLVTRVVIDLTHDATHVVSAASGDWRELRVQFTGAAGAIGATGATGAAAAPAPPVAPMASAPVASAPVASAPIAQASSVAPVAPVVPVAPATVAPQAPATVAPQAPATVAPAAPGSMTTPVGTAKQFTGHPISLDFQGADLRAVLRTFAEISGLNIVIDPAVQGSVDVSLRDVPWDQALDIILRANKLGYSVDGTIVRVAPLNVLADEEKQRRTLTEAQALSGELHVMTMTLSYATAEQIKPLLLKSALSQRGSVEVDQRSNTLIISDLQASLDKAANLITTLDRPQPQVEIEARIVITNKSFRREVGAKLGLGGEMSPRLGNTTPLAFPNSVRVGGDTGARGSDTAPNAVNLGVGGATSALGLALGAVNGAFNLDLAISALEKQGKLSVISTPRVSTQNNVEAEITQGTQIPIQVVANNTVTVQFKDAALKLTVTPQITAANTVIMKIQLENATADFANKVNGIPPIDTQRATTTVLIGDGQTTVIGGIYFSSQTAQEQRTPMLHKIPLLGWLFKDALTDNTNTELLIFITPRILKG